MSWPDFGGLCRDFLHSKWELIYFLWAGLLGASIFPVVWPVRTLLTDHRHGGTSSNHDPARHRITMQSFCCSVRTLIQFVMFQTEPHDGDAVWSGDGAKPAIVHHTHRQICAGEGYILQYPPWAPRTQKLRFPLIRSHS